MPSDDRSLPVRIFDDEPRKTPRRLSKALTLSIAAHACTALVVGLFVRHHADLVTLSPQSTPLDSLVWLSAPGPTGGGGANDPAPARKAQQVGNLSVTVPVRVAPDPEPRVAPRYPDERLIAVPVLPLASRLEAVPGAVQALADLGSGSASSGTGSGIGNGRGPGIGNGPQGVGDGPGGRGTGLTGPQLVRHVRPNYTENAMRANIQGMVGLEAIVLADGSVGDVKVVRSLDAVFGLDQEAIKTVKQWRFLPGTRRGQAVAMAVNVELTFTLR